ncbi:MAG: transglycosylase SLT domain-containing protein [Bdellovibrio sp.]
MNQRFLHSLAEKKIVQWFHSTIGVIICLLLQPLAAQEGGETSSDTEDTPVVIEEIAGDVGLTGQRPWRPPDFSNQEQHLGYRPDLFSVPQSLQKNFQFWLDIYTKYTTDQGVLHDSENLNFIYQALDFSPVVRRTDLNLFQKERERRRLVKYAKQSIEDLLLKLHHTKNPDSLNSEERRVWDAFRSDSNPRKFLEARKKNRLRFQLGQRDRMILGIFFSGRYLEEFERIFRETQLPLELTRLVFVESSFNVLARSKVGASGLWQIMRATGRPHLMMTDSIDKRNHPIEATKMAARFLKNNFVMLEDWPLAITGYNHGPSGVQRLTRLHRTRDLGEIANNFDAKKRLGFASRNFYASFLAALEAERRADFYFGVVRWSQALAATDIKLAFPISYRDILRWFDGDDQKAQIFNPHITSSARKFDRPLPRGALISVPQAKSDQILAELEELRRKPSAPQKRTASSIVAPSQTYLVQIGDSFWSIAREFGISHRELMRANPHLSPEQIKPGESLQIP